MPKRHTIQEIIALARKVHGDKYDYSKAVYRGIHTKFCVICPEHGEFWPEPNNHIYSKSGCPICAKQIRADKFRSSSEEFIKRANIVHNGKYDYSKVVYHQTEEKVCIICPEHGEFWQSPHNHLQGATCPKCSGNYIPTTDEFIASVRKKFGDKYNYSKVVYRGNKYKVCLICPNHGEFWITPNNLLQKSKQNACPKCCGNYGIDKDYFIKLSNERFEGKYNYEKVVWKGYTSKVCIICPEHGDFYQTPNMHLRTLGCPKCSGAYMDRVLFIQKSQIVHHNKYDYSKVEYVNSATPVCIICPQHGEYYQKPNTHIMGHGCRRCHDEKNVIRLTKTEENFISIAKSVHGEKYDYSQIQYVNRNTPIKIICPKHGPFVQAPKSHIRGSGCPMCNNSILEDTVTRLLQSNIISFIPHKTFDWLTFNGTLHLDFYLPDHDIAIECQGIQHFQPVEFWGGKEGLEQTKKRDMMKKQLCEKKGIQMLYFSNLGIRYPYRVIEDPRRLLQLILSKSISEHPVWAPDPELPLVF